MKKFAAIAAALAMSLSLAGSTYAAKPGKADKAAKADKPLKGKVVSVGAGDGGEVKIVVHAGGSKKNAQDVTVTTNADTVVTLDGKTIKADELQPGERVTVTPAAGIATKIDATKKEPKADKEEKPAAK